MHSRGSRTRDNHRGQLAHQLYISHVRPLPASRPVTRPTRSGLHVYYSILEATAATENIIMMMMMMMMMIVIVGVL